MGKYKIKITLLLTIIIIILGITIGCNIKETPTCAEEKGDEYFYDSSTGKIYTDQSKNFDFKIEKWKYYFDKESNQDRILLSIAIKNKSKNRLNNFLGIVSFDEKASKLIASGITKYDKNEPHDLIPETTANGVAYAVDILVEKDEWLKNLNKEELLEAIRNITLELSWEGGKETVHLTCDKLEKSDS